MTLNRHRPYEKISRNNQYLKSEKNDKKDEDLDHDANVWVSVKYV
mgnify:CR=1 FL=1